MHLKASSTGLKISPISEKMCVCVGGGGETVDHEMGVLLNTGIVSYA